MPERFSGCLRTTKGGRLQITHEALREVKVHAKESYPQECCGLLLSRDAKPAQIVGVMRTQNSFGGPRGDRYSIDPLELGRLERGAAEKGFTVAGIYHSHPDYPAILSSYDLSRSFPWYIYIVISVVRGKVGDMRCWVPAAGGTRFTEDALEGVDQ